ncbi:MAG: hypothetical protein U0223_16845 [Nitrospira sp.]|nr:hypothetical protein [Nitrospira sp.]
MIDLADRQSRLTATMTRKAKRRAKLYRAQRKRRKPQENQTKTYPTAQVSQFTRDRLFNEALQHPAYEGMPPDEVRIYINGKIDEHIASFPWWYGWLAKDQPRKPATEAQLKAVERMRARKREMQAEVDAPYVPDQISIEE